MNIGGNLHDVHAVVEPDEASQRDGELPNDPSDAQVPKLPVPREFRSE